VNVYLIPLSTAAVVFPLIAALLTVPYVLYCYRKYGSISVLRSFILFSFVFYLQCAYYLTILPLPDPALVAERTDAYYQLYPFFFIYDIIANSPFDLASPRGWLSLLTSSYIYVPLFNILLTLPFGIYLAYYFRLRLRTVILLTFALSLFFEVTQLSGLFGVYSRPYRLADVDDLILNTLGGAVGYFVYTRFLRFLPSREWIDKKSIERAASVGYLRRFVAFFVDCALVGLLSLLATALFSTDEPLVSTAVFFFYFLLFALPTGGWTPGKALVRIRLAADVRDAGGADGANAGGRFPLRLRICARYLMRNTVLVFYQMFTMLMQMGADDTGNSALADSSLASALINIAPWLGVFSLLVALITVIFFADFLLSFRAKRGKRLWYERLSKTHNISTLKT
jgi:glycopeptide antibiotics resistance protein